MGKGGDRVESQGLLEEEEEGQGRVQCSRDEGSRPCPSKLVKGHCNWLLLYLWTVALVYLVSPSALTRKLSTMRESLPGREGAKTT